MVRGPIVGATIDGQIDYARDDVRMRGTFVPLYGLNNMFGQIPIVGLFLGGGSNEGLVGITYEVVGSPSVRAWRQPDFGGGAGLAAQVLRIPATPARTATCMTPTPPPVRPAELRPASAARAACVRARA